MKDRMRPGINKRRNRCHPHGKADIVQNENLVIVEFLDKVKDNAMIFSSYDLDNMPNKNIT
jgi:hypothetical protein